MLKKTMTFKDYNGEDVTEDFYFNLNKAELIELEVMAKGGFSEYLQTIVKSEDYQTLLATFKKIIVMAVGRKSDDGRRFVKNDEVRDAFMQTEAYSELLLELAQDASKAAAFINAILPAGLNEEQLELPTGDAPVAQQAESSEPAWVKENREPNERELRDMTPEQLREAYLRKLGS